MLGRDYIDWLFFTFGDSNRYDIKIFNTLASIEYRSQDNRNQGRLYAGLQLRSDFAYDIGVYEADVADGPCSVLEFICALGREMYIQCSQASPSQFVWEMLDNLDILTLGYAYQIEDVVSKWLNGDYGYDGSGGIYAIPGIQTDMRTLSVWEQMHLYLNSYYPLDEDFLNK